MRPKGIPAKEPETDIERLCKRARRLRLTAQMLEEDGHHEDAEAARTDLRTVMAALAEMEVPPELRERYLG